MKRLTVIMAFVMLAVATSFHGCDCSGKEKINDADIMKQLKDKNCDDCSKY